MSKSLGVMCCGCNRMMAPDGKPLTAMAVMRGVRKPSGPVKPADIAWFSTKKECDTAAKGFGWRAENGNHRCPECVAEESKSPYAGMVEGHGAYIRKEDLGL